MNMTALFADRFAVGLIREDGTLLTEDAGYSTWCAQPDGRVTTICPRCMEPAWHLTRHAVERHGDTDVEVLPVLPGKTPPDWFQPDWI